MKHLLYLVIGMLLFIAGYNYGLYKHNQASQAALREYRALYYQALEYQDWSVANLPYITKAPGLKEKEIAQ